jgi:hypothetical protein
MPRKAGERTSVTLVMAFVGTSGAAMAGDRREITTFGDPEATAALERELFSGLIRTDEGLFGRAGELGVRLSVRDDKVKVSRRDGVLVGEVTAFEGGVLRRRRLYATAGAYSIVDTGGGAPVPRGAGGAANFVVLGNELTKAVANTIIGEGWRNGSLEDAIGTITRAMIRAAGETPSVSRQFILLQTRTRGDIAGVMEEDGTAGGSGSKGSRG